MLAIESRQIFAQIEQMVTACPRAELTRGVASMRVPAVAPDGFDMRFAVEDRHCHLTFDRWSLDFASNDQRALDLFELALHGGVRLRIDTVDGGPWRWTLERQAENRTWVAEQSMGFFNFRFWGTKGVTYLQNDFGFRAWSPAPRSEAAA